MVKNKDKKRITICIDAEAYTQIEKIANESGTKIIAAVIRQAIYFYLKRNAVVCS